MLGNHLVGWDMSSGSAYKADLARLTGGDQTPNLLFTAAQI